MNRRGFLMMGAAAAAAPLLPDVVQANACLDLPIEPVTYLLDIETNGYGPTGSYRNIQLVAYAFNPGKAKGVVYRFPDRPVVPVGPLVFDDSEMEVLP